MAESHKFELYHASFSTCSQKVRLCMAEKGIAYESRVIDLSKREQLSAEYLEINPNGVVPTLLHDGEAIIDSSVICEYLDEVVETNRLSPNSSLDKARMRAWMRYIEEVPTTAIRVPSFNRLFAKALGAAPRDQFEAMAERMPLRKHFYLKMQGKKGFDDKSFDESVERLSSTIDRMERSLGKQGPWLMGEQFTIADITVIPTLVRMEDIGLSELWSNAPNVAAWYDRIQERPSFDVAYYPGSRITPEMFGGNDGAK